MKHRWAALLAVLALSAFLPQDIWAQSSGSSGRDASTGSALGQNYPNPFNPETTIPFSVGGAPNCADQGRQYRVSLRIYNLLTQLVAVPVLQGGSAGVSGGQALENVLLTCGQYTAYWDGKYRNTGREVASGIYIYRLEVNGRALFRKMIVTK
ncbi:MAG TPA: hypothetical protein VJ717_14995 [Gemmatimonadaceae bacterium]|nr:hypothetical protein [Gemmatimonadaceae bacterium]